MILLVILSGIIAYTGKLADASCVLRMIPPKVVVRYGDPLSAICNSTSEIEGIGWESTFGGTGLVTNVSSLLLDINPVETWELAPLCYASLTSDGSQCTDVLQVTVYKLPNSVSMSLLSGEGGPMVAGQKYQMKCDVVNVAPVNKLSIKWYKDSELIYADRFQNPIPSPENISSVLNLTANRNVNGIDIWCEAKLELGSDENPPPMSSKSQKLTVLYPPTFEKPSNETVELLAGKTVSLNCTALGNPMPVYRWDFPDPTVETNGRKDDVIEPILTPAFQIPGTYICTASNALGNSTKYFSVVSASEDRTTFAAILGVLGTLGVLLLIAGPFLVTQSGTFSFNKNNYIPGQPTSSGPV